MDVRHVGVVTQVVAPRTAQPAHMKYTFFREDAQPLGIACSMLIVGHPPPRTEVGCGGLPGWFRL